VLIVPLFPIFPFFPFSFSFFSIINDSGVYAIKNLEHFEVHLNMLEKYTEDDISQLASNLLMTWFSMNTIVHMMVHAK